LDCMLHCTVLCLLLLFVVVGLPNEAGVELIILIDN
jgi:hypothetical protein